MSRQKANLEILKTLERYFMGAPDIRFNQALFNLGINEFDTQSGSKYNVLKDKYQEESVLTLQKLTKS